MSTTPQPRFIAKSALALAALTLSGCPINVNLVTDKPITIVIDKPIEVKLSGSVAVTKLPPITLAKPLRESKKGE